jgi:hypothetical protein
MAILRYVTKVHVRRRPKMPAIIAREYIQYMETQHLQPKKVEAKDAAAYKEAPAQTFLRPGNVHSIL